ncbi:hypothetical protein B5M09_000411 [Aphanomyces astaci]|uniref:EF-hand domain-containing protein n=1 Tax=Aphanomyces astaci TaxID=112090 RepID=A0A425CUH9_APHAT|nr:hypothetical protein B5M09_000411 [Aphanomyces astaci]
MLTQSIRAVAQCQAAITRTLKMAASAGYIQIDWKKVEKDAIAAVDPNGDGKITPDDFKIWWKKFLALSKHNLPSSGMVSLLCTHEIPT